MKKLFLSAALPAVAVMVGCQSAMRTDAGQGAPAATAPAPAGRAGRGGTAMPAGLRGAMSDMERMMNAIKADAADPAKIEQTITNLSLMERDVAIAKLQTPQQANGLPTPEDREKVLATFRSMLNGVTRTLLDLEDAVNARNPEGIKKAIDQLEKMEKAGHKEFGIN
jgi:hypothetical protein